MGLACSFKPSDQRCRIPSIVKTLKGVRRHNDPAGGCKALEKAVPVVVEVLGLIDDDQRITSCHPLPDCFLLQQIRCQIARAIKFTEAGGVVAHQLCNETSAPCGNGSREDIECLAFEAPAE